MLKKVTDARNIKNYFYNANTNKTNERVNAGKMGKASINYQWAM